LQPQDFTGRHIACANNLDGTSTVVVLDIRGPNKKGEWRVSEQHRNVAGDCNAGFVNYFTNSGYQINFQNAGINNADGSISKSFRADVTTVWATAFTTAQQQGLSSVCAVGGCCNVGNLTRPVDITPCNVCSPLAHYYSFFGTMQFNLDSSFYVSPPSCVNGAINTVDTTLLFKRTYRLLRSEVGWCSGSQWVSHS